MTNSTIRRPKKPFTGWHMTGIFVVFFGVIVAVNVTMAKLAASTFGGVVVENSYVASQNYNDWLQKAEAQEQLGWTESITLDTGRHVVIRMGKDGAPLSGLAATGEAHHPLGRTPPVALTFAPDDTGAVRGAVRSEQALPAGRWQVMLSVRHNADLAKYKQDVR